MKIIFFGTPPFASEVFLKLIDHGCDLVAIVTKEDKPKGRSKKMSSPAVKLTALEQLPKVPIYQPKKASTPEFVETLKSYEADLFVVVAYGEILNQQILDLPKLGCINIHASLLPKYRGAAPIQRAVMDGETETGVTIMHMVRKMDAGDIIDIVKVPIGPNDTFGYIQDRLCEEGSKLLVKVIDQFKKGTVTEISQDHSKATMAPKIELEDCEIDWSSSAKVIHNLIRGVNPYPGAWCYVNVKGEKKRLKIKSTEIASHHQEGSAGQISNIEGRLMVHCGQGSLILNCVQLEGKRAMSAEDLYRGTLFTL